MWLRRGLGLGITLAIVAWILKPIVLQWDQVKEPVSRTSWPRVLLASVMFCAFLFLFRALCWRRILIAFGYRLPIAASTRIWSTSELARYLPGIIWQLVGRAYLVRPYGVSGSVCSASQVLELAIFLLANVLLALGCLTWLGIKTFPSPIVRAWLFAAMGLVPVLVVLVHPRVFYRLTNYLMARLGKPAVAGRLRFHQLGMLLIWSVLGLVCQSLAIWIVVKGPLHLQFTKWWVVAGAYSLAWCAGFLAFWAPGGIGIREAVFIAAMEFALPPRVKAQFHDPRVLLGFLAFLSVLLRVWATTGELMLAAIAYGCDYRGALGRDDAPGRGSTQFRDLSGSPRRNSQVSLPTDESSSAASPPGPQATAPE